MSHSSPDMKNDPFFFDQEDLQAIASEQAIRLGLSDFKEYRVIEIDQDKELLWGMIEADDSDIPVRVEIRISPEGEMTYYCECLESDGSPCRHQVAALYAYADQFGETNELLSAADIAIKNRMKRGRSEVRVEAMSGEPWFGTWRAASATSTTHFAQNYRVTIRSLHRRANLCSCPDFANNQLGTCKHIEAVLHKVKKHPQYDKFIKQPVPRSYIYLAWDVDDAPKLRIHRSQNIAQDLNALCDDYFDAGGIFKGRLPDDFFRLVEILDERDDIHIGEDGVNYNNHLAASFVRKIRAKEISTQIVNSNGRLPGIKARLYPYQIEGVAFLAGTGRVLLADDMGLGKTLQAISAAVWLKEHEGVEKILIISPASLKQQWAREIKKFTGLDSQIIQGPPQERGVQYRRQTFFFIVNYELILRDISVINETLRPDLIIMDEAQRIKNWRTKIASAVKLVPSRYAFVLSGTPLENRLEDLYSLMQVVDPKILGPLWRYMIDYHVTDDRGKVHGYRNLSLLRKKLEPIMLRRDRRLVRDQLPDRIEQRLDVSMTAKQIELHDAAMQNAGSLAQIAKRRPLTPSEQNRLMASLQQARMACDAAGLVDKETEGSPKLDELADLLNELCLQAGLKVVVFSQWELMTRMVEAKLHKMGIGCVRLHGRVPTANRGALMDRFREDDSVQVFLSTDAGGVGLNLQSGSVLINLDVPWNPAVLEQRNARIHRLGQTKKVQIITMVAADSYEENVLALVQTKQNLFDNVISEDATEDVVGVSKKLLETLLEDLKGKEKTASPPVGEGFEEETIPESASEEELIREMKDKQPRDSRMEKQITYCIEELQKAFGARIERIFGSGGGLLAVIDRVDSEADQIALRLSETIPVGLIDHFSLKGLSRLGAASPLAEAQTYYDAAEAAGEKVQKARLQSMAEEKFKAAGLLVDQQLPAGALELLLSALLAKAAHRAGLDVPIDTRDAGVWIYSEALPKGFLNQREIGSIMQCIALTQSASVPDNLVRELVEGSEPFITNP